uniref:Uncharacterized protein n=1 Tax=Haplochromis burtoni TaxID=8153 RepID=A0A3Q2UXX4_HAPBU
MCQTEKQPLCYSQGCLVVEPLGRPAAEDLQLNTMPKPRDIQDMIQVETGYIDKNTWLDWITYTASTNNMIECVACSTARPTLFTVTAPLLFREDRPGFDCMLQLHMKEELGHDYQILSALFPVVRKGVTPPLFSPRVTNYTCLTRVSVTPIGNSDAAWCNEVIDVTE